MKRTVKFIQKFLALAFLLLSFLILDAALLGALPFIGAVALLPAALLLTGRLFALSLRPSRPAKRRASPQPAAVHTRRRLRVYRRAASPPAPPIHAA